jgi:single-stranded DNA-binding protein
MNDLNRVEFIGRSTKVTTTETEFGKVGRFGIYTTRYAGKDKDEKPQYIDEVHNCQVSGKLAESVKIGAGDLVYAAGEIRYKKTEGVMYTNIHINELKLLKKKEQKKTGNGEDFPQEK